MSRTYCGAGGRRLLGAVVVVACAAWSCGGSSRGEDDGGGGTGGSTTTGTGQGGSVDSDNCTTDVLSSLDEDCDGIGSAQMLLDLGAAEQIGTMTWAANMGTELTHEPSSGTTEVTVRLTYGGGEARCHHTCDPCPGMSCGPPIQGPYIDIDVILEIDTADGALAESVPGVASGWGDVASFAAEVLPSDVQGTMTLTASGGFEVSSAGIYTTFTSGSATGNVQGYADHVDPNGPSLTRPIGSFTAP